MKINKPSKKALGIKIQFMSRQAQLWHLNPAQHVEAKANKKHLKWIRFKLMEENDVCT